MPLIYSQLTGQLATRQVELEKRMIQQRQEKKGRVFRILYLPSAEPSCIIFAVDSLPSGMDQLFLK